MPSVTSVSPASGFTSGQNLVIQGSGFSIDSSKISVSVDDVPCDITSTTLGKINCQLREKTDQSALLNSTVGNQTNGYIGGSGFYYARYSLSGTASNSISSFKAALAAGANATLVEQGKRQTLHTQNIYGTYYGEVWKGYFYAPTTGNYTFQGAADDYFSVLISSEPGTTGSPLNQIIYGNYPQGQIDNYYVDNVTSATSAPLPLVGGNYYYMEVYHVNVASTGFLKVSAQVPNNDTTLAKQTFEVDYIETTVTNDP